VRHFQNSDFPLYQLLLDPPAWSLGIELSFYMLAPFIVRKGWGVLLGFLLASLGLRAILIKSGLSGDPWSYRFFPNELATFLTGCVAYRIYRAEQPRLNAHPWPSRAIAVCAWAVIACIGPLGPGGDLQRLFSLAVVASTLPFMAVASRTNRIDRFLGNLSYPIYICHWLGMRLINQYMKLPNLAHKVALTVAAVVIMAMALELCIDQPIEKLRTLIRDRSKANRQPMSVPSNFEAQS
jgi:peptidoglycan/LPS O-acetylase OafA/YrhL